MPTLNGGHFAIYNESSFNCLTYRHTKEVIVMARPKKVNRVFVVVPTTGTIAAYADFDTAYNAIDGNTKKLEHFSAPTGMVESATFSDGTRIQMLVIE
jgi:hypothetical protein